MRHAGTGGAGSCRRLGVEGTLMNLGYNVVTFQLLEFSKALKTSQTVSEMAEKPNGWPLFPKFMRRLMPPMLLNVKQLAAMLISFVIINLEIKIGVLGY